jgi:hypothetical protein
MITINRNRIRGQKPMPPNRLCCRRHRLIHRIRTTKPTHRPMLRHRFTGTAMPIIRKEPTIIPIRRLRPPTQHPCPRRRRQLKPWNRPLLLHQPLLLHRNLLHRRHPRRPPGPRPIRPTDSLKQTIFIRPVQNNPDVTTFLNESNGMMLPKSLKMSDYMSPPYLTTSAGA